MNSARVFLFFAFGLLSFMLWNAWQQDFSMKPVKTEVVDATGIPHAVSTETEILNESSESDTLSEQRLIHVKTDVLDIAIDCLGGNIVSVKLLKYPDKLHSTQPFVLLSPEPDKFYISQSGLVGRDLPGAK